jgi:hypothetical protein
MKKETAIEIVHNITKETAIEIVNNITKGIADINSSGKNNTS